MSTANIMAALDWMRQQAIANPRLTPLVKAALLEVKDVETAAMDVSNNGSDGASVETFELFDAITEECARRPKVDAGPE